MTPLERDALFREIARINQMMLLALQLGFHDEVRHWKKERQKLTQRLRDDS